MGGMGGMGMGCRPCPPPPGDGPSGKGGKGGKGGRPDMSGIMKGVTDFRDCMCKANVMDSVKGCVEQVRQQQQAVPPCRRAPVTHDGQDVQRKSE